MTDAFDKWINGMSDEEYEDWLEDEATNAQEEKALNIRTPPSKQEEEDMEALQEYEDNERTRQEEIEEEQQREQERIRASRVEEIVYDNRDLPVQEEIAIIRKDPSTNRVQVQPIKEPEVVQQQPQQSETQPRITITSVGTAPKQPTVQQPRQSRLRRFVNAVNIFRFFRRNRK